MNKYVTRLRKQIANTMLVIVIIIANTDYIETHNFKSKYITLNTGAVLSASGIRLTYFMPKLNYPPYGRIHVQRSRSFDRA